MFSYLERYFLQWEGVEFVLTTGCLLLVYRLVRLTYNLTLHPLARFPGPTLTAISRLPLVFSHFKGKQYQFVENLHDRYGPIVRIAPDEITITAPQAWNEIYACRPALYKDSLSLQPPLNNAHSLFTAEGAAHLRLRRVIGKGFSEQALRAQSPVIVSHVEGLITGLKKVAQDPGAECDIAKWYGYTTVDILSDLILGKSLSSVRNETQHPWITSFFIGAIALKAFSKQRLTNWRFMTNSVTKRLEGGTERSDFISAVVDSIGQGDKGITREELNTNTLALMMAGAELPAVALSTATFHLLSNPDTYKKLNDEVRTAFSSEDTINLASTEHLPYLNAVIDESLRLHHPTPSPMPRVIPKAGLQLESTWLPGGTVAGIALGAMLRSAANFAAPLEFHPERFLPGADSQFMNDNRDAFKPFSVGQRTCIGSRLALVELRVILAKVSWNFDMDLVDNVSKNWLDQRAWIVCENKPLMIHLKKRNLNRVGML